MIYSTSGSHRPRSTPTPPSTPRSHNEQLPHNFARAKFEGPHRVRPSPAVTKARVVGAMDAINIPSESVPADLRQSCEQILKRAKELKKAEPVVSYWCCFSAAQKALKIQNRSAEGTKFLLTLLDTLEEMKALLDTQEAVITEAAGAAYIENFALKVFMSADNDDRNGNTGKGTIRKFVIAGQFIEVLSCFENGMTEEMQQKLVYARWKAADGAKALREGRTPASGPPMPESEFDLAQSPNTESDTLQPMTPSPGVGNGALPPAGNLRPSPPPAIISPRPSPAVRNKPALPDIDTLRKPETPQRSHSSASMAWSTVATPGLADDDQEEIRFRPPPISAGEASSRSITPLGEKKNVRFMGPDGAPLSPAETFASLPTYPEPVAPPPTEITSSPTTSMMPSAPPQRTVEQPPGFGDRSKPQPSAPPLNGPGNGNGNGRPRGDSFTRLNGPSSGGARPRGDSFSRNKPPVPSPALPPAPVSMPHSNGALGLSVSVNGPPSSFTRKQVDQAQKHAKFAVSALDYDDYETARSELRKALTMIGG